MRRGNIFKVLSILLPLGVLILFELILRLAGYGKDLSLFIEESRRPRYLHLNGNVSQRYFLNEKNATNGNAELFLKNKPDNLTRVFIQGESTAVGFPYFHNGAFPRMLEYQLRYDFPDKDMEIINLSMTALNSYAVYDFVEEIIEPKPDAVIINAGHNEYYGALGVGSTSTFGSNVTVNRLGIWFRKTKVGQLISKIFGMMSPEPVSAPYDQSLMKRMVRNQQIPFASKKYFHGINQYRKNMDKALALYHKAGVKIFITNSVSNYKDLKPFVSTQDANYNADIHYARAKDYYKCKEYDMAKEEYTKAKDYDALRFRAPEAINEIVEELARKYDNVELVDIKGSFENHSEGGIIGDELLLEHVHPNLYGHFIIASAIVQSFKKESFLYDRSCADTPLLSFDDLPLTEADSLTGVYSNWLLREGWPFYETIPDDPEGGKSLESAVAGGLSVHTITWDAAMATLIKDYIGDEEYLKAIKIAEALVLEYPYEHTVYEQTIKLCMDAKEYEKGIRYAKRSLKFKRSEEMLKNMVVLCMNADKPEEALPYIDILISTKSSIDFAPMRKIVLEIIAQKDSMERGEGTADKNRTKIYNLYTMIGNTEAADKYAK